MNIKELKEYIKDLPDDMEICNKKDNSFITANFDDIEIRNHEYNLDYAMDSNGKYLTENKEFLYIGF